MGRNHSPWEENRARLTKEDGKKVEKEKEGKKVEKRYARARVL